MTEQTATAAPVDGMVMPHLPTERSKFFQSIDDRLHAIDRDIRELNERKQNLLRGGRFAEHVRGGDEWRVANTVALDTGGVYLIQRTQLRGTREKCVGGPLIARWTVDGWRRIDGKQIPRGTSLYVWFEA